MFVITRSGTQEPCRFDKITDRITSLAYGLNPDYCDPVRRRGGGAARQAGGRPLFSGALASEAAFWGLDFSRRPAVRPCALAGGCGAEGDGGRVQGRDHHGAG
jgi:hypothetical protein